MNEKAATAEDGEDPSMDDILDSIRKILSDDEKKSEAAAGAPEPAPEPEPLPATEPIAESKAEPEPEPEPKAEPEPEPGLEPEPEPETDLELEPEHKPDPDPILEAEPAPDGVSEHGALPSPPPPPPSSIPEPVPMPPAMEAMLELTPDMIATDIMSEPTAKVSTDVLSELAAAILDRRDLAIDTSRSDTTLEGIVREMLKPILREWLDRNLPYLVERLVKREIDLMVNRAERLED